MNAARMAAAVAALLASLVALGAPAQAQRPDRIPAARPGLGTVVATVYDSLAARPLGGATVQLVSADDPLRFSRTGETDSLGLLTFRDIPLGRYSVGFLHPMLDALGVEAPVREMRVENDRPMRAELAVPSATRLRTAICGRTAADDSSGVIIGTVRDPRDLAPLADARIAARWLEITFTAGLIRQRPTGVAANTGPNGWFALCGLPAGTVTVAAGNGRDSTPELDLQLTAGELRLRDLYVAAAGHGRLAGRVIAADSAKPLARARVMLAAGPQAEADAKGEWALSGVPLGTRMLEVRALGYYPVRRVVDALADAPPVEVVLTTFQAVLDAVHVTASRTAAADLGGFDARQRGSGMGRFLSAERIARYNPISVSDIFRALPGFTGDGSLTMRSNFSDGGGNFGVDCVPDVYVDGNYLPGISASELDGLVPVENIAGIEVYSSGSPKPAQFESGMSGCGALVIWLKPMHERVRRRR